MKRDSYLFTSSTPTRKIQINSFVVLLLDYFDADETKVLQNKLAAEHSKNKAIQAIVGLSSCSSPVI